MKTVKFEELIGKTLVEIVGAEKGSKEIYFRCSDGSEYKLWHEKDCCEYVRVEDICGNPLRLLNFPILKAEESISKGRNKDGTYQYTFYLLATVKGYLNIRWLGESNGYYSESVDFVETANKSFRGTTRVTELRI